MKGVVYYKLLKSNQTKQITAEHYQQRLIDLNCALNQKRSVIFCYIQALGFFILWEIQGFGEGKEKRSSNPRFLSLSQVTLVRARATSRAHLCKAPDCGSTSDLKVL